MRAMADLTSLFLAPQDPFADASGHAVSQVLRELKIIGDPLGDDLYRAGDNFSRHVVFAGCSPHLVMEPPEGGSRRFCHVALHGPFAQPKLVTGPNTVKPRCPHCRKRFDDWREHLQQWLRNGQQVRCEHCGTVNSVHTIDWREHALSGRYLIELRNVFPGEATPSDVFLQTLEQESKMPWRYAWAAYLDTD